MDRLRATALLISLAALNLIYAGAQVWTAFVAPLPDRSGGPVIPDFLAFWAAGRITLAGDPALAYDWAAHRAVVSDRPYGAGSGDQCRYRRAQDRFCFSRG